MFARLQRESKQLIDSVVTLIYFMRGSLSYTEAMNMSQSERTIVSSFVEKRLDAEKNSPHPVY